MEKINFVNDTTPALNATNLNMLQDNVEDAIDDAIHFSIKYAQLLKTATESWNFTAWTNRTIDFSANNFSTNNSDDFEFSNYGIKCKFSGTVLIIRKLSGNVSDAEVDISAEDGGPADVLHQGIRNWTTIHNVSENDVINLKVMIGKTGTYTFYKLGLIVIRLSY